MERKIVNFGRSFALRFNNSELKQILLFSGGGFFCALASRPEGAPLFCACCAYALRFPLKYLYLLLPAALPVFLLLPDKAQALPGALITFGIFAFIQQLWRKHLSLPQISMLLGAVCLAVELPRQLWLQNSPIYSVITALLTMSSYYALAQSLPEIKKWQACRISPPKDLFVYPLFLLMLLFWGVGNSCIGNISLQYILFDLSILSAAFYLLPSAAVSMSLLLGLFAVLACEADAVLIGYLGICSLAAVCGQKSGKSAVWGLFFLSPFLFSWMISSWSELPYLLAANLLAGGLFCALPECKRPYPQTSAISDSSPEYAKIAQTIGTLGHFRPMYPSEAQGASDCSAEIYILICHDCTEKSSCWQYNTASTAASIQSAYQYGLKNGTSGILLNDNFRRLCKHSEILNEAVIAQIMLDRQQQNHQKHIEQLQQLCADELVLIGQTLREMAYRPKSKINERTLRQYCLTRGLPIQYARISLKNGTAHVEIVLKECIDDCVPTVISLLGSFFNQEYLLVQRECNWQNEYCRLFFAPAERYFLSVRAAQRRAVGETVCGDLWRYFKIDEQCEAVFLIDGMGIGDNAYRQSVYAADMLEELLKSSVKPDEALKLINNHLLLVGSSESFITLEVLLINLLDLSAVLYKAAGTASYLLQAQKIEKITAASLPLGILSEAKTVRQTFKLQAGERIVLLSDGLTECRDDWENYLPTLPAAAEEAAAEIIASSPTAHDDQSAVIVDVWSIKQNGS